MLQTGDLAVLSREHDAAQLAAHVVLGLHEPPAVHLAVAQLHCTQSREARAKQQQKRCTSAKEARVIQRCRRGLPVTMCPSASCSSLIGKPMLPIESGATNNTSALLKAAFELNAASVVLRAELQSHALWITETMRDGGKPKRWRLGAGGRGGVGGGGGGGGGGEG